MRTDVALRFSVARRDPSSPVSEERASFVAVQLLWRYGVVFHRLLAREKIPVPWRDLVRLFRRMELQGTVRGGRFVGGFAGEQYAMPEAVEALRAQRRKEPGARQCLSASDPLNLGGILTPEERIPSQARRRILVG